LQRLWNAQWKPRITTIAATKHLQLRLAGDAYSVSGRTVRSPQVAPWLSTGPSAHNAYPSPDAQAASPVIPTVIVKAIIVSAIDLSHGARRAIGDSRQGR